MKKLREVASQAGLWYNKATIKSDALAMLVTSKSATNERNFTRMDIIPLWSKFCPRCQQVKPIEDFSPGTIKPYGLASYCKECHRKKYPRKPVENQLKACSQCSRVLSVNHFHRDKAMSDGFSSSCKECHRAYVKKTYIPQPRKKRVYEIPDAKQCKKCLETKPIDDFSPARGAKDKHHPWCKSCTAEHRRNTFVYDPLRYQGKYRQKKYGLTPEQYDAMIEAQGGVCAVCKRGQNTIDPRTNRPRALAVDHDHTTGRVRGLQCDNCNKSLGCLEDDPELIRALMEYAIKWKGGG